MTIDPRWGFWLSICAAVLSALVGAGATFTDIFGADNTKVILGVVTLLNTIVSAANAVLHAIPSAPNKFYEFPLAPAQLKDESRRAQDAKP